MQPQVVDPAAWFNCVECGAAWPWKFLWLDAPPQVAVPVEDLVCGSCYVRRLGLKLWTRYDLDGGVLHG